MFRWRAMLLVGGLGVGGWGLGADGSGLMADGLAAQTPQPDYEASRRRLEDIRAERDRLRREQQRLESQVRDAGAELRNIERQREVTNRLVNELERQMRGLGDQLLNSSQELALAQDNLLDRRAVLERRLIDIYKRGTLYTFQVLLTAESFGDLLSRYKYLYLQNRQDRSLVQDIGRLETRIRQQRGELVNVQEDLDRRREERASELKSYVALADERSAKLGRLRRTSESTRERISTLERDEARLNDVLAALERARRAPRAGAPRPVNAGGGDLTTADLGSLDWPVSGRILFQFGRDTLPSGAVIRRNGIGIGAAAGSPVRRFPRDGSRWCSGWEPTASPWCWSTATDTSRSTCSWPRHRSPRTRPCSAAPPSAPWAVPTPTRGPICTSRFGERTRSRWIRPTG